MNPIVSQYFEDIAGAADENISLAEAVLYIAMNQYPQLNITSYLDKLEAMAASLQADIKGEVRTEWIIKRINDYLFEEQGFSGNWRDFNQPENSYLNDVLDRKLGIPISLSIIYIELGRLLGLDISGVSFPGHFLVKYKSENEEFIIDPFSGGIILQEHELIERLQHINSGGKGASSIDSYLASASTRAILIRVMRNLKYIFMDNENYEQALSITNLQLILEPESPDGLRDRALIFEHLDCYRAASEDLQQYLILNPQAGDYEFIHSRLTELQHTINRLH